MQQKSLDQIMPPMDGLSKVTTGSAGYRSIKQGSIILTNPYTGQVGERPVVLSEGRAQGSSGWVDSWL